MSETGQTATRGGLVIRSQLGLRFIPSEIAASVTWLTAIVPVPGLVPPAVGIAVADDRVATVISVGEEPGGEAIVCEVDGGWVALMGARVLATGRFDESVDFGDCIEWEGETVETIDLRGLMIAAETAIWRARGAREEAVHK
jgi:hypothetical protein